MKRIQRQRTKGWRMPEGAIYVGRPTRWGNPWRVTRDWPAWKCVEAFRHNLDRIVEAGSLDATWIAPLRGHDLACWCALDEPCHADVLLELAR